MDEKDEIISMLLSKYFKGYNLDNIKGTEGGYNDWYNLSREAMDNYADAKNKEYSQLRVIEVLNKRANNAADNMDFKTLYVLDKIIQELKSSNPDNNDLRQVFPDNENMR